MVDDPWQKYSFPYEFVYAFVYGRRIDTLSAFLDGPRARGAFLLRSVLEPPWSLRIQDEAPLTLMAVVRGSAWIAFDEEPPVQLLAGDVAIERGPAPYTVSDEPDRSPRVLIEPGQRCTTLMGESLSDTLGLGVRTWGNAVDGATLLLTGTYTSDGQVGLRLTETLPPLIVLRHSDWRSPLVDLLADEITRDDPGQDLVLDRLLDLLLVAALRSWFSRADAPDAAWYQAYADPVIGAALRLLQNDPARAWSVTSLAAEVGVSRAAFARRFHDVVGEPPMTFLTNWRLALAADLLLEPEHSVSSVARQVGYHSPFTFSTAFKRRYGVCPSAHRAEQAA
ncbi:AraC family transcriptional regulator [soil metagenome]